MVADLCRGLGEWFCDPGLCDMCDRASGRNRARVLELRYKAKQTKLELARLEAELSALESAPC